MASTSETVDESTSTIRPQFFLVILEDSIEQEKLEIPRKFWENYERVISKTVYLNVPDGTVWKVELSNAWFSNGWSGFSEYYSLQPGSLLHFEFKSCDQVGLTIYNKSATQIFYPSNNTNRKYDREGEHSVEDSSEDDDSIEIEDDLPISQKSRENSPLKSPRPRRNTSSYTKSHIYRSSTTSTCFRQSGGSSALRNQKAGINRKSARVFKRSTGFKSNKQSGGSSALRNQKAGINRKSARVFKNSTGFKSNKPYFELVMCPTYINSVLYVPIDFAKKYLTNKEGGNVTICADGRTWSVKYMYRYCGKQSLRKRVISKRVIFDNGWKEFVHDLNIKCGETFVLELVDTAETIFKFHAFGVKEDSNTCMAQGQGSRPNNEADT